MRVLILADIHANAQALRAISEPYDFCVCVGDVVEYGPDAKFCVDWVRDNCRYVVRGNHDHGLAQCVPLNGQGGYRRLGGLTRTINLNQVDESDRRYLAALPATQFFRLGDIVVCMVHATPRDPLDEYVFIDEQTWSKRVENIGADLVLVGHTHHQFQLELANAVVVNPGSVGQPRDGDPRAAYAIWEDGRIELKRVPYDIEATVDELKSLRLPEEVERFAARVLRNGGQKAAEEGEQPG